MMFRPGGLEGSTSYQQCWWPGSSSEERWEASVYHLKKANERCPPPLVGLFWYLVLVFLQRLHIIRSYMETDPTNRTATFDSFDIALLKKCGIEVSVAEVPASEAVTYAAELIRPAMANVRSGLATRQDARTDLANQIIDSFQPEYFAYLRQLNTTQ